MLFRSQQHPWTLTTAGGLQVEIAPTDLRNGTQADISIRPEKIHLMAQTAPPPPTHANHHQGEVQHTLYTGPHIHCIIELNTGEELRVLQPNHTAYRPGTPVHVSWAAPDSQILINPSPP